MRIRLIIYTLLIALTVSGMAAESFAQATLTKTEQKRLEKEKKKEKRKKEKADRKKEKQDRKKEKKEEKKQKKEKKKEQKEQKDQKGQKGQKGKKNKTEPVKKEKHPKAVVKKQVVYPPSQMKARYRIDVLASLYLEELTKSGTRAEKEKVKAKAAPGIAFYEGVNLAADSLKKAGFNFDIYIHDITSTAESPAPLVSGGGLDSSNLVIGAVQAKDIPVFADFAGKKQINFVSALSATDAGVKDNPYFTLLQPSLKSHCEWISANIAKKYPGQKVTLLYRTSSVPEENAWKYLGGDNNSKGGFRSLLCNQLPGRDSLKRVIDTTKPDVVIISVLDIDYADSLLHLLSKNFPLVHFEVFGMPSWSGLRSIHKGTAFHNLSINVTDPFNFDPSGPMEKNISLACEESFEHKPSELVFRGYETLFWYARMLNQYGTVFNGKYNDNSGAPVTKFEVKMQWDKDGNILYNENTHIYLSTYQGGVVHKE